jgi:hypothetical protein
MKTKTLLIAAATLAVGVIGSQAAVYSANVVGYVNIVVSNGYNAINIPVDYDGTGTNNQVVNIIGTNVPNGTTISTWNSSLATFNSANTFGPTSKNATPHWTTPTAVYNPGQGLFINNPSNFPVSVTIVGTVLQGGLTNNYITQAGFSLVGNQFPVAGGITTTYGYTPKNGDTFSAWNQGLGTFSSANTYGPTSKNATPHWTSGEPQLSVAQGAFISTTNQHPVWGTNFVIPTP